MLRLPAPRTVVSASLVAFVLCAHASGSRAQTDAPPKPKKLAPVPVLACDEGRAVALVEQQVADARSFEKPVAQISVMTRAADLLWAYREETARAIFSEAFDLATKYYRLKGDETKTEGAGLTTTLPDQRFVVMRAIARRDAQWARRLAEQTAEETKHEAEKAATGANAFNETGMKLIDLADSLLPIDQAVALALARSSFRYPLTLSHPEFFFEVAKRDRAAADALVADAIRAYATQGTTEDFSYLSVYVFGLRRNISQVRAWTSYQLPEGFAASPALEEAFVRAIIARADVIARAPDQFSISRAGNTEMAQINASLVALEPLVAAQLPTYSERLSAARSLVQAAASQQARESADSYLASLKDWEKYGKFDVMLEEAERETRPEKKDYMIARVVMAARTLDALNRLESLAEKVSDTDVRRQLLNWINFNRAQRLVKDGLLDEAKRAADRVDELDHRAILYFEIAREGIKQLNDKARAAELLDEVLAAAAKAPLTDVRARTQLGIAHLFAEFDPLRSLEVLGDAVKTINQLTDPDLSSPAVFRRIEGKGFGVYGSYVVPGFTLENAFREAGPHDFEGALLSARNLRDPAQRATAITGLAAHCLEESAKRQRQQQKPTKQQSDKKPQP